MTYSKEYYRYLILILKGATLVHAKDSYIDCFRLRDIPISLEMVADLIVSQMVELDGGNTDLNETFYVRTEDWRENLSKLQTEYPQFFRKQKIHKLLKNDK